MEEFKQQMKNLASRLHRVKDNIHTEEATKTALIMPLLQMIWFRINKYRGRVAELL